MRFIRKMLHPKIKFEPGEPCLGLDKIMSPWPWGSSELETEGEVKVLSVYVYCMGAVTVYMLTDYVLHYHLVCVVPV